MHSMIRIRVAVAVLTAFTTTTATALEGPPEGRQQLVDAIDAACDHIANFDRANAVGRSCVNNIAGNNFIKP